MLPLGLVRRPGQRMPGHAQSELCSVSPAGLVPCRACISVADALACSGTSIGKRYARTDELGVPYDITVDGDTVEKDGTVTLRERDTTGQVWARSV